MIILLCTLSILLNLCENYSKHLGSPKLLNGSVHIVVLYYIAVLLSNPLVISLIEISLVCEFSEL